MKQSRTLMALGTAALCVCLSVAACASSGSTGSTGTPTPSAAETATSTPAGPPSATAFCALFTQDVVADTGSPQVSVQANQKVYPPYGTLDSCTYAASSSLGTATVLVLSVFCPDVSTCRAGYDAELQKDKAAGAEVVTVANMGDAAYRVRASTVGDCCYKFNILKGATFTYTTIAGSRLVPNLLFAQHVAAKLP